MAPQDVRRLDPDAGKSRLERWLPIIGRLQGYGAGSAGRDVVAGLVVAVLLFPQAMAYALLAGLPPSVGLYAAAVPTLGYALFGSSRYLAVGPVALVSLLAGDTIARFGGSVNGFTSVEAAGALALLVGAILVAGGLLRLGVAADFLGKPVLDGFTAGAAVLIATSQLRHFLGLDVERAPGFVERMREIVAALPDANLVALSVGAGCLALLLAGDRLLPLLLVRVGVADSVRGPLVRAAPLLVLVLAAASTAWLDLGARGVAVVGSVEIGLPPLGLPDVGEVPWLRMLPSALVIALIVFVIGIALAESLKEQGEPAQANREMVGLGAANLVASVTGGYAVGASVSRSAIARDVGARTPFALVIAGAVALGGGLLAGDLLQYLPKAALAALIMMAAVSLIEPRTILDTWRYDRGDGAVLLATFGAVVLFGVDIGLGVGAVAGLLLHLVRTSRPRVVVLGRQEDSEERYASAARDDVATLKKRPVMVIRVDEDLYFGNARHVRERIIGEVTASPELRCLLLDLGMVSAIDTTACAMLESLRCSLADVGVDLAVSELKLPLRQKLDADGLLERLGAPCVFERLADGVETLEARNADANQDEDEGEDP